MKGLDHSEVPLFLQYEITYFCQSRCIFCYNPSRYKHPDQKISWKIAEKIKEEKIPSVQITGGECTTFSGTIPIAKYLSEDLAVTIVTNAIKKINFPEDILGLFISLHGKKETHERLTQMNAYEAVCKNIRAYINEGFDVSADVILTSQNFDEMHDIIEKAHEIGMSRVYINRFEPGGMGSERLNELMPNIKQFRHALTQIIKAREDYSVPVLFGTAIPFCIDKRMMTENLNFSCGAGTWFGAIDPYGNLRICNQAKNNIGNILDEGIERIWNGPNSLLSYYRELQWVTEPCSSCPLLNKCVAGCRIDNTRNPELCIDCYLRNGKFSPDINNIRSAKPKKPAVTVNIKDISLNSHIKIVKRKNGIFVMTPKIGVYKIEKNDANIVEEVINNKADIASIDDERIKLLYNLGVVTKKS